MQPTLKRIAQPLTIAGIGVIALGYVLLGLAAWYPHAETGRSIAQVRWTAGSIGSYRISLRLEYRGEYCYQQIEVQQGRLPRALRNTCDTAWLDLMTVPQLFDLSRQIESIPAARCYPSTRWCVCQRVFSARVIQYDEELGYPSLVMSRSDLQPHWAGLDFWRRMAQTNEIPSCGPSPRRLTVQVLALTALP